MPLATTDSVAVLPELIDVEAGCVLIDGATPIVIVLKTDCASPETLLTFTQYRVVTVKVGVVNEAEFVPTGADVTPTLPRYHW